jgi:UDP:flavonoid glycosyltransferase YjiC (YdhE family)
MYCEADLEGGHSRQVDGPRRVLIIVYPEHSAYNATFILARRLSERGFQVFYATDHQFESYVRDQGFNVVPFSGIDELRRKEKEWKHQGWWKRMRLRVKFGFAIYRRTLDLLEGWLRENPTELVLLEPVAWQLAPAVLRLGIPIIGLSPTLTGVLNGRVPPVSSPKIQPSAGWISSLMVYVIWLPHILQLLQHKLMVPLFLSVVVGPLTYWRHNPLRLIKRYGGRLLWGEYGYRLDVPELVTAPRAIDFPEVCSRTERCYVGACVDPGRQQTGFDFDEVNEKRPLIYCSLGTYAKLSPYRGQFYRAVVEAARRRPQWLMLIQIDSKLCSEVLSDLPENVRVSEWFSQLSMLRRASLFITHGGFSSVRESLYYGVPMVVFPCRADQPGNAARIVVHGLGLRADIKSAEWTNLLPLIDRVMLQESFRDAALKMQRVFRDEESCSAGADFIERYLAGKEHARVLQRL